ncbi:MAG: hypothetical protein ABI472_20310 [Ginsengibacter sp.]
MTKAFTPLTRFRKTLTRVGRLLIKVCTTAPGVPTLAETFQDEYKAFLKNIMWRMMKDIFGISRNSR